MAGRNPQPPGLCESRGGKPLACSELSAVLNSVVGLSALWQANGQRLLHKPMAGASLAVARAAFEAQHSSELSVADGERLWVLAEQPEAASAEGWRAVVKYSEPDSKPGLVPADYLEHGWYGEVLADFAAEAEVEMTIVTGQRMCGPTRALTLALALASSPDSACGCCLSTSAPGPNPTPGPNPDPNPDPDPDPKP